MAKDIPSLPPNVSIFSPKSKANAKTLQSGSLFTRLSLSPSTSSSQLSSLKRDTRLDESFCHLHSNNHFILIFDAPAEGKDLQDVHHEHFRTVCLVLKDLDISLSVAQCVHDAETVGKAGFQLEELSGGAVMVVDLMGGDDDDSDEEGDGGVQFLAAE